MEAYSGAWPIPVGDTLDITVFGEEDKSPEVSLCSLQKMEPGFFGRAAKGPVELLVLRLT